MGYVSVPWSVYIYIFIYTYMVGPPPKKKNKNLCFFNKNWSLTFEKILISKGAMATQLGDPVGAMFEKAAEIALTVRQWWVSHPWRLVAEGCLSFTRLISYPSKYENVAENLGCEMWGISVFLSLKSRIRISMFRWGIFLHLHRNQSGFQDGIGQFGFWVAQVFAWFLPLVLCAPQQQGAGI